MKAIVIAATFATLAPTFAGADDGNAPESRRHRTAFHAAGPLDAGQVQAINHAGRSVLVAKRGHQPGAEQAALRDELKALAAAIDAALAPRPGAIVLLRNNAVPSADVMDTRHERFTELRARVKSVRTRRQRIEGGARQTSARLDQPTTQQLATKVAEIEREIDAAVNASGNDRIDKLRRLRERLQAKTSRETSDERFAKSTEGAADAAPREEIKPPDQSTPTLSTLARHR